MNEQTPRTDAISQMGAADVLVYVLARQLERELSTAQAQIAALEAKIDALMLEYCPDEMSPEQLANWAAHQKPAPEDFK